MTHPTPITERSLLSLSSDSFPQRLLDPEVRRKELRRRRLVRVLMLLALGALGVGFLFTRQVDGGLLVIWSLLLALAIVVQGEIRMILLVDALSLREAAGEGT